MELSIDGDEALGGRATLPAGQTIGFVPLLVKDGTKAAARSFRVSGTATIDGKKVARFGTHRPGEGRSAACRTCPWSSIASRSVSSKSRDLALELTMSPIASKGEVRKILVEATRGTGRRRGRDRSASSVRRPRRPRRNR